MRNERHALQIRLASEGAERSDQTIRMIERPHAFSVFTARFWSGAVFQLLFSALLVWVLCIGPTGQLTPLRVFVALVPVAALYPMWLATNRRVREVQRVARHGELLDAVIEQQWVSYQARVSVGGTPRIFTFQTAQWAPAPLGPAQVLASIDSLFALVFTSDGREHVARGRRGDDRPLAATALLAPARVVRRDHEPGA